MTTAEILEQLPRLSALIVGDVCLDRWCLYDPAEAEPSRETGIPRIAVVETEVTAGAGGTVANNLAAMGVGRVAVAGVSGCDGHGHELRQALAARGISTDRLVASPEIQTFTYTKLIRSDTGVEDLPRVDYIHDRAIEPAVERQILDHVQSSVEDFDVIIVADQAETNRGGVVTPAVRDLLADLASNLQQVFIADSRRRIAEFRGLVLKPNQQEAEQASRQLFGKIDYEALRLHTRSRLLAITHGGDGVLLVNEERQEWVPARKIARPVDICGAGDSFCAGMAVALAVSGNAAEAARFGNLVASITIMKPGTGTASPQELLDADTRD
ncbi:MAG: bifunctional heptose 7-phosphate kinase/heptose 1-phosphate adenyltransferase [Bryobacteraceae bacterium]